MLSVWVETNINKRTGHLCNRSIFVFDYVVTNKHWWPHNLALSKIATLLVGDSTIGVGKIQKGVILSLSKYVGKGLYAYASTSSAWPKSYLLFEKTIFPTPLLALSPTNLLSILRLTQQIHKQPVSPRHPRRQLPKEIKRSINKPALAIIAHN